MLSLSRLIALCLVSVNSLAWATPAPPNVNALPIFNDGFVIVSLPQKQQTAVMTVCPRGLMYFESRPNGIECAEFNSHGWNGGYVEGSQTAPVTPQQMLDREFKSTVLFVGMGPYGLNNQAAVYYRIKSQHPPAVVPKSTPAVVKKPVKK